MIELSEKKEAFTETKAKNIAVMRVQLKHLDGHMSQFLSQTVLHDRNITSRGIAFKLLSPPADDVGVIVFESRTYLVEEIRGGEYYCKEIEFKEYSE